MDKRDRHSVNHVMTSYPKFKNIFKKLSVFCVEVLETPRHNYNLKVVDTDEKSITFQSFDEEKILAKFSFSIGDKNSCAGKIDFEKIIDDEDNKFFLTLYFDPYGNFRKTLIPDPDPINSIYFNVNTGDDFDSFIFIINDSYLTLFEE